MPDLQLALDRLFMGIAARQRNEDLRGEEKRCGEVKLHPTGSRDAGPKCFGVAGRAGLLTTVTARYSRGLNETHNTPLHHARTHTHTHHTEHHHILF